MIEAPVKSGTLYHNYKGTFSIVLLAVCNVKYNFTLVDVGQYGSNNDSRIFAQLYCFENNTWNLPEGEVLPGTNLDIPYFLVGDEIFGFCVRIQEDLYNNWKSSIITVIREPEE